MKGPKVCCFKEEYLGAGKGDQSGSIFKICKQLQKLEQEVYTNGKLRFLIPEILSNQFTTLATYLSETSEK